jgi:hypothetical protein
MLSVGFMRCLILRSSICRIFDYSVIFRSCVMFVFELKKIEYTTKLTSASTHFQLSTQPTVLKALMAICYRGQ